MLFQVVLYRHIQGKVFHAKVVLIRFFHIVLGFAVVFRLNWFYDLAGEYFVNSFAIEIDYF